MWQGNGHAKGPGFREINIDLTYKPTIPAPPPQAGNLYQQACSGDDITVKSWKQTWIDNYKANKERFGSFAENSIGELYGSRRYQPCVILGAGPSLRHSFDALKENQGFDFPVTTVSCLHNYAYLYDNDIYADYYVSLDAGDVVCDDFIEGGKYDADYYWNSTKGKTLIAIATSPPKLFEKWQGKVYLFNSLIPDADYREQLAGIEKFQHYVSCGGNVLGACLYIAKALFCCDPVMFTGADFCFDYDNRFHGRDSKYDNFDGNGVGDCLMHPDVFGIMRKTWPSYYNFKCYFDDFVQRVPGNYISCSEGILGSYHEGNIGQFRYMPLSDALLPYKISQQVKYQPAIPGRPENERGEEMQIRWKDVWADSEFEHNITLY